MDPIFHPSPVYPHVKKDEIDTYNASTNLPAVLLVVSILSFIGALSIILSTLLLQSFRYFRHNLIMGYAISDLLLTLNFMISTSMELVGYKLGDRNHEMECELNGFMTQMFIIQTDYWSLVVAICTFFLLGWGGRYAVWIRANPHIIWCIPWGVSLISASLCYWLIGYGDVGGWCWLTHDHMHLYINYIPRWTIIVIIFIVYTSLFYTIKKGSSLYTEDEYDSPFLRNARGREESYPRGCGESIAEATVRYSASEGNLKKASMRMIAYPLAFTAIWFFPTAVHTYHATGAKYGTPDAVTIVEKACVAGQGLAHAIVYSCTERLWQRLAEKYDEFGGVEELPWNREVQLAQLPAAHR